MTSDRSVQSVADALLERLPEVYGYRFDDEPADITSPGIGRDARLIVEALLAAGWKPPADV
jgi:hypothetical protein